MTLDMSCRLGARSRMGKGLIYLDPIVAPTVVLTWEPGSLECPETLAVADIWKLVRFGYFCTHNAVFCIGAWVW